MEEPNPFVNATFVAQLLSYMKSHPYFAGQPSPSVDFRSLNPLLGADDSVVNQALPSMNVASSCNPYEPLPSTFGGYADQSKNTNLAVSPATSVAGPSYANSHTSSPHDGNNVPVHTQFDPSRHLQIPSNVFLQSPPTFMPTSNPPVTSSAPGSIGPLEIEIATFFDYHDPDFSVRLDANKDAQANGRDSPTDLCDHSDQDEYNASEAVCGHPESSIDIDHLSKSHTDPVRHLEPNGQLPSQGFAAISDPFDTHAYKQYCKILSFTEGSVSELEEPRRTRDYPPADVTTVKAQSAIQIGALKISDFTFPPDEGDQNARESRSCSVPVHVSSGPARQISEDKLSGRMNALSEEEYLPILPTNSSMNSFDDLDPESSSAPFSAGTPDSDITAISSCGLSPAASKEIDDDDDDEGDIDADSDSSTESGSDYDPEARHGSLGHAEAWSRSLATRLSPTIERRGNTYVVVLEIGAKGDWDARTRKSLWDVGERSQELMDRLLDWGPLVENKALVICRCGSSFTRRNNWKRHVRRSHGPRKPSAAKGRKSKAQKRAVP